MLEIIFKSLCIVLIVYAVITIIAKFIAVASKNDCYKENYFVILKIKNDQEQIEGIVRSIIWKSLSASGGGFVPNILIVDRGTGDETINIINKLMEEYKFIFYITEEEFETMKEKFVK